MRVDAFGVGAGDPLLVLTAARLRRHRTRKQPNSRACSHPNGGNSSRKTALTPRTKIVFDAKMLLSQNGYGVLILVLILIRLPVLMLVLVLRQIRVLAPLLILVLMPALVLVRMLILVFVLILIQVLVLVQYEC